MDTLESYLAGRWTAGSGSTTPLHNPATEEVLAHVHADGYDLAGALALARAAGRAELQAMSFLARGEMLAACAAAVVEAREELIELAVANGGNTRGDAKFDIDGASATLSYYAELAKTLGDRHVLVDGEELQLGRTARFAGQHIHVSRPGVAVFINAFNFPAWGIAEKAATAWLAGVPVIAKPATATALVAHRLVQRLAPKLPAGALQLYLGGGSALLGHLDGRDVLAFTGSSDTAAKLRAHAAVCERGLRLNVEADSVNAAVLGPDIATGSETWQLFINDVARDLTQKAGQKCTAIRRVLVPMPQLDAVTEAIAERLAAVVVGDPRHEDVRMGPLATASQRDDVRAQLGRLAAHTTSGFGELGEVQPRHVAAGRGYFVGPVLRKATEARACAAMHAHEIFGPVSTLAGYDGSAEEAGALVGLGQGSLVASLYSDDKAWQHAAMHATAPWVGRLYLGSEKMAAQSPGPGTALPAMLHGGPGRAGGGEELGGLRGALHYMQRVALQGDATVLRHLTQKG